MAAQLEFDARACTVCNAHSYFNRKGYPLVTAMHCFKRLKCRYLICGFLDEPTWMRSDVQQSLMHGRDSEYSQKFQNLSQGLTAARPAKRQCPQLWTTKLITQLQLSTAVNTRHAAAQPFLEISCRHRMPASLQKFIQRVLHCSPHRRNSQCDGTYTARLVVTISC